MFALAVAALLIRPAQEPGPRLEFRAATLARLLPAVGAALGEPMRAAPAIAGEIGLASLPKGQDPAAFRAAFARAFAGEWRRSESGEWVFGLSERLRAEEDRASLRRRVDELRAAFRKLQAPLRTEPTFDDAAADGLLKDLKKLQDRPLGPDGEFDPERWEQTRVLEERGPGGRTLARLLASFPIEELARIPEDSRAVFSSRPTRMQKPMPGEVAPTLAAFVREQGAWANAAANLGESDGRYYSSLASRKDPVSRPPAFATLTVRNQYGSLSVSMKVYDGAGLTLTEANADLGRGFFPRSSVAAAAEPFTMRVSPESRALAAVMASDENAGAAAFAPFADVAARDPLSYGASDFLLSYARERGRPLVAAVPDSAFYLGFYAGKASAAKDDTRQVDFATALPLFSRAEEDGFLLLKPEDPSRERSRFLPREDLARAIAILRSSPRLSADAQAALAASLPDGISSSPLLWFLMMAGEQRETRLDDRLVKLYGRLDEGQRKQAASASGLPVSALDERQAELLRKIVYDGDEWSVRFQMDYNFDPTLSAADQQAKNEAFQRQQQLYYGGYLRDTTFSMPDGVPRTATIRVARRSGERVRSGPVLVRWGSQPGTTFDAEEMAAARFQSDNPQRFPWANEEYSRRNWDQLTRVDEESVTIDVKLTKFLSASSSITSTFPIDRRTYRLEELPADFLAAYRKAYQQQVNQYQDQPLPEYYVGDDHGGRRVAPP